MWSPIVGSSWGRGFTVSLRCLSGADDYTNIMSDRLSRLDISPEFDNNFIPRELDLTISTKTDKVIHHEEGNIVAWDNGIDELRHQIPVALCISNWIRRRCFMCFEFFELCDAYCFGDGSEGRLECFANFDTSVAEDGNQRYVEDWYSKSGYNGGSTIQLDLEFKKLPRSIQSAWLGRPFSAPG